MRRDVPMGALLAPQPKAREKNPRALDNSKPEKKVRRLHRPISRSVRCVIKRNKHSVGRALVL